MPSKMTPHRPQIMMGILANIACIELSIYCPILLADLHGEEVQKRVDTISEICDESMSRGHYAGSAAPS
jgi:hypothetical protein